MLVPASLLIDSVTMAETMKTGHHVGMTAQSSWVWHRDFTCWILQGEGPSISLVLEQWCVCVCVRVCACGVCVCVCVRV